MNELEALRVVANELRARIITRRVEPRSGSRGAIVKELTRMLSFVNEMIDDVRIGSPLPVAAALEQLDHARVAVDAALDAEQLTAAIAAKRDEITRALPGAAQWSYVDADAIAPTQIESESIEAARRDERRAVEIQGLLQREPIADDDIPF